ncbi:hypothetical protein WICPIJ_002092 [Wickerhamomyces pijperi]|uniref:Uncharacterized protein n=1 Tax=Wickerhamomyces pijperi TaxID=599730 RepID=A0A9P8TQI5_WICPI|nr:hypothetical protein WICPIJ_002092 [Wickerhamomyces pijperi]
MFNTFPVRWYASLKVMDPRVKNIAFLAQSTASYFAPVVISLLVETLNGSEQAVILLASSGLINSFSSLLVLVAVNAATIPPPEVPLMISGKRSWSNKALITPKWL